MRADLAAVLWRLAVTDPGLAGWHLLDDRQNGLVFFFFSMVKAITPRYRYDQLMRLGWKVFLPFSLFWVVFVAFAANSDGSGASMPAGP